MIRLEVEWLDTGVIHTEGWEKKEKILEKTVLSSVTTVGFKFAETEDALYLALSYDAAHQNWFGVQAIAKSAITKVTLLRARRDLSSPSAASEASLEEPYAHPLLHAVDMYGELQ